MDGQDHVLSQADALTKNCPRNICRLERLYLTWNARIKHVRLFWVDFSSLNFNGVGIFSTNKQKLALLCPYIVSNFYFCHRILLEVLARKVWDLIFSLLPKTCYCKAQFQFQSSRTEYSLNPDYFYPPPSTHPRDSSNEALLDYLER